MDDNFIEDVDGNVENLTESGNSDSDGSSDVTSDRSDDEQFERDLPSRHQYLGELQELSGRTVVDEDDFITIPLLDSSHFGNLILLPNQMLPLTIYNPREKATLLKAIARDKLIGLVHTEINTRDEVKYVAYGTTAEIFQYNNDDQGALSIKSRGMQRFRVHSIRRDITGSREAKVKILPEIILTTPLAYPECRKAPIHYRDSTTELFSPDFDYKSKLSKSKIRSANTTVWPSWVYDLYDTKCLSKRLTSAIRDVYNLNDNPHSDTVQIPESAIELSQWAAINLHMEDSNRLELLALNTANQRLRYLLSVVADYFQVRMLTCSECEQDISAMKDVFSLSAEGLQGTFSNPSGFVHEMFTIKKACGLRHYGSLTSQYSWFPGYSWLIVNCDRCLNHIGWKFVADNRKLKPQKFYGISRRSVVVRQLENSENTVHYH